MTLLVLPARIIFSTSTWDDKTVNIGPIQTERGYHLDWEYRTSGDADNGVFGDRIGEYTNAEIMLCTGNGGSSCDKDVNERDYTNVAAKPDNLNWTVAGRNANWADSTSTSALIGGFALQNVPTSATINTSPTNNFGSAAIDGLLINHMKFTTKGL